MASFLEKEIGPFTGGVWLIIIVGGVGLAFLIKRGVGGGGGGQTKTEPLLAIETQTAPRVFGDVGQYGGSGGSSDSGEVGTPLLNPSGPKPVVPPMQPEPHKGPPGGYPGYPGPRPRTPPAPTQPAPKQPAPTQPPPSGNTTTPGGNKGKPTTPGPTVPAPGNVPGNLPTDCQGVIGFPTDYPGNSAQMLADLHASKNKAQRAGKYLGWTIGGVGSAPIPTKLQAAKAFVGNRINWPLINQIRRTRGLRAMNSDQFAQMAAQIAQEARSGRDAFSDTFLAAMWDTWYEPFVCRNPPRRLGAKQ